VTVPTAALLIRSLRAEIPGPLPDSGPSLRVVGAIIRIPTAVLSQFLPAGLPVEVVGINADRIQARASWRGLAFDFDIRPQAAVNGRLQLRFTDLRAAGILPLPAETIIGILLSLRMPKAPGVFLVEGRLVELDYREVAREVGLELPGLTRAGLGPGYLELTLGSPAESRPRGLDPTHLAGAFRESED
jgi:hypothetical protein